MQEMTKVALAFTERLAHNAASSRVFFQFNYKNFYTAVDIYILVKYNFQAVQLSDGQLINLIKFKEITYSDVRVQL